MEKLCTICKKHNIKKQVKYHFGFEMIVFNKKLEVCRKCFSIITTFEKIQADDMQKEYINYYTNKNIFKKKEKKEEKKEDTESFSSPSSTNSPENYFYESE